MKKVNLIEKDNLCLSSYHKSGIIQTRNSGMIALTNKARDKINKLIIELANNENNRQPN